MNKFLQAMMKGTIFSVFLILTGHGFSNDFAFRRRSSIRVPSSRHVIADIGRETESTFLEKTLHETGFSHRLLWISSEDLPLTAEIYRHGRLEFARICSFQMPTKEGAPPRFLLEDVSNATNVWTVDVGQITTIWDKTQAYVSQNWEDEIKDARGHLPVQHNERAMQNLYDFFNRRSKNNRALTKKELAKILSSAPDDSRAHTEATLRKLLKAGKSMIRLVDSTIATDFVYQDIDIPEEDPLIRRAVSALFLAEDSELGGRFKRMPCTFVGCETDDESVSSITLVNGGWLTLDTGVRAGTEARKFVQRSTAVHTEKGVVPITAADERIVYRLECLAMGDVFSSKNDERKSDESSVEVDVKEALKAMDLPVTPQGARTALVRTGRWSTDNERHLEPWSHDTLGAAKWYSDMSKKRGEALKLAYKSSCDLGKKPEERADLTMLPCACIDAKSTSFRDDAIGVRPRSSTGRKVAGGSSRWEVLIHIMDVSDMYSPLTPEYVDKEKTTILREAAASRGVSRYDLPLGPLHLLPPVATRAMSFDTLSEEQLLEANPTSTSVNRCVTVWAYIDENDGSLLDAGLERSLVAAPTALSYHRASSLLDEELTKGHPLYTTRKTLSVVERNLMLWNKAQCTQNSAARRREERLSARQLVDREMYGGAKGRDNVFDRNRGHKIVDAALDLYSHVVATMLKRTRAPIPRASGSGDNRGGRVGTAPLRRFVDGMSQRQALSVLCGYGGPPLTKKECKKINSICNKATNMIVNVHSTKKRQGQSNKTHQREALHMLQGELRGRGQLVPAISTGQENKVVVAGVGAVGTCKGVRGSLSPGQQVMVRVLYVNPEKGILKLELAKNPKNLRP